FLRQFHVHVQKPKDVASCGTCAAVHLRGPVGLTDHESIAKACCEISRSIRASAVGDNDLSVRCSFAQMLKKPTYQRCLIENRNNDRKLHLNNYTCARRSWCVKLIRASKQLRPDEVENGAIHMISR